MTSLANSAASINFLRVEKIPGVLRHDLEFRKRCRLKWSSLIYYDETCMKAANSFIALMHRRYWIEQMLVSLELETFDRSASLRYCCWWHVRSIRLMKRNFATIAVATMNVFQRYRYRFRWHATSIRLTRRNFATIAVATVGVLQRHPLDQTRLFIELSLICSPLREDWARTVLIDSNHNLWITWRPSMTRLEICSLSSLPSDNHPSLSVRY